MIRKGMKRDLLLFLALIGDLYREISYREWRRQLNFLAFGGIPRETKSYYSLVYKLTKAGEIEKEIIKGEAFLKITAQGGKLLDERIPLRWLAKKPWDRRWRMVIFDIPEKERTLRDKIREKLVSLGFGMWQRSVYITPHNVMREIQEFLETKKLFPACVCLTARRDDFGDDRWLASQVFKLDEINTEYKILTEKFEELRGEAEELKMKELKKRFWQLWGDYKNLLMADPWLPKELLPENWFGDRTRQEFKMLTKIVLNKLSRKQ